jgi:hypothetical protein
MALARWRSTALTPRTSSAAISRPVIDVLEPEGQLPAAATAVRELGMSLFLSLGLSAARWPD